MNVAPLAKFAADLSLRRQAKVLGFKKIVFADTSKEPQVNLPPEVLSAQIRTNLQRTDVRHLRKVFRQQEKVVALVGGGWSLDGEAVRDAYRRGCAVVAMNGSAKWCLEQGLRPAAHVLLDGREFNLRFVEPPVAGVRYLVASQAHPSVFDALRGYDVLQWQGASVKHCLEAAHSVLGQRFPVVRAGCTVALASLDLLRMLGFTRFELFGIDSCLGPDGQHHAYSQPENDQKRVIYTEVAGKKFAIHGWMAGQAEDFMKFSRVMGEPYEMVVHGDGLIAHIVRALHDGLDLNIHEVER